MEASRPHDAQPHGPRRVRTRQEALETAQKGALKPQAGYELWFQDETEPSLLPYLVGCWGPRGEQTRVSTPGKNAKRVVFGAVRSGYDRFIGLTCPRKNGTAFCELLTRIALHARRIRKKIFLVTDNARFHKTKKGEALIRELAAWVKIVWLPKYSSNLNAIEVFWKHMKRTCFGNTLYRSAEEFERHVDEVVERMCRDPEAVLGPAAEMRIAS